MQFKENQTIYLQIAERISDEILLGHYDIGARIPSVREYAALVEGNPNKKGTGKLQLRMELDAGASVKIEMEFDSDGVWRPVDTLETTVKRSFYLPIIPRRSDHFKIRLTGTGGWRMYSLVRENYIGSELKSQPGRQ